MTSLRIFVSSHAVATLFRRATAAIVSCAILTFSSPLLVLAEEMTPAAGVITSELQQLAEAKPELIEQADAHRDAIIDEVRDAATSWTARRALTDVANNAVEDLSLDTSSERAVVASLKEKGAFATMTADDGTETEINQNLTSDGDALVPENTPFHAELARDATSFTIAENPDTVGDIVSTSSTKEIVDTTPKTTEEVRYFNRNAATVDPAHEGNKALYRDIWPSTDLLVTSQPTGVKEDIILKNKQAPTAFEYLVETVGLSLHLTTDGGLEFRDADGNVKFETPAPDITDTKGKHVTDGVRYALGWETVAAEDASSTAESTITLSPTVSEAETTFFQPEAATSASEASASSSVGADANTPPTTSETSSSTDANPADASTSSPTEDVSSEVTPADTVAPASEVATPAVEAAPAVETTAPDTSASSPTSFVNFWRQLFVQAREFSRSLTAAFRGVIDPMVPFAIAQEEVAASAKTAAPTPEAVAPTVEAASIEESVVGVSANAASDVPTVEQSVSASEETFFAPDSATIASTPTADVVAPDPVNDFFAPEQAVTDVQTIAAVQPCTTGTIEEQRDCFSALTDTSSEVKVDGQPTIYRYKLRLVIDTQPVILSEAKDLNATGDAGRDSSAAPQNDNTLTLADGTTLTYPLDLDPSTFLRLTDRGSRTFAPDFSQGTVNSDNGKTNGEGRLNRGTETVQTNGARINAATSGVSAMDASGDTFAGNVTSSAQDWSAASTSLRTNKVGAKIRTTPSSSGTANISYSTAGNYTYDNTKVDVTGSVGKLKGVTGAVTWDPANSSTTLSNGLLTSTMTAIGLQSTKSTRYVSSGKWYWEIKTNTDGGSHAVGVASSLMPIANYIGYDAYGWGYFSWSGNKDYSQANVAYGSTYTTGDVIGVALDMDNGKLWFSKNGVWQATGDPVLGTGAAFTNLTGQTVSPTVSYWNNGTVQTANFGATAFSYSVPSGFSAFNNSTTTYPTSTLTALTTTTDQISTTGWTTISSATITETKPTNTSIYYATSFDGRHTFKVNTTGAWRTVVSDQNSVHGGTNGVWYKNTHTTYGSTTWTTCTTNAQDACLSEAFTVTANQMTGTQMAAISSANWGATGGWTAGNTINLATGLYTTDNTVTPSVDNVAFTYTSNTSYSEIWAGLTYSPAGGIVKATIDKGTGNEVVNYIDTYSATTQSQQKSLIATGLPNATHTVELELTPKRSAKTGSQGSGAYSADSNTVLLLHGDGANGSAVFTDSETTPKTVTVNGNAQISTGDSRLGGASGYFDGNGDYLSFADSNDWNFAAGDFTIDWWQKFDGIANFEAVWNQRADMTDTTGMLVYRQNSNLLFYASSSSGALDVANGQLLGSVMANRWYHFAVVRNGNTFRLFQNGILQSSFTSSATLRDIAQPFRIGAEGGAQPAYFKGYIDEFRVSKGAARWTNNFIPSGDDRLSLDYLETYPAGSELAATSTTGTAAATGNTTTTLGTALTAGSTDSYKGYALTFTSGTQNGKTLYVTGNTNGTNTVITFTPALSVAPATSDTFTLTPDGININGRATRGLRLNSSTAPGGAEFDISNNLPTDSAGLSSRGSWSSWVKPDFAYNADTQKHFIWDTGIQRLYYDGNTQQFTFQVLSETQDWSSSPTVSSAAQSFTAATNIHLATTWNATTGLKLFVNGTKTSTTATWTSQTNLPATIKLGAAQGSGGIDKYTKLDLHLENNVTDSETTPKTVTNNSVTFSSSTAKMDSYSGSFNGTSSYLTVPNSSDFEFGSGDFTADWWEYRTSSITGGIAIARDASTSVAPYLFGYSDGAYLYTFLSNNSSSWSAQLSLGAITLNTWNHFAVVRKGNIFYDFKNGQLVGSQTSSITLNANSNAFSIGRGQSSYYFPGYLDEVRISKGIARWTTNFAPPSRSYDTGYSTDSSNQFTGTIAEPQLFDYVLTDTEALNLSLSSTPSVSQNVNQKIEETRRGRKALLFNAPMVETPGGRVATLAGTAKLSSTQTGTVTAINTTALGGAGKQWSVYDHGVAGLDIGTDPNSTKWNANRSRAASVIKDGGIYKMWFSASDSSNANIGIMYAESTDGKSWTTFEHAVAGLTINSDPNATKWDSSAVLFPSVIKDGATYKMWYQSYGGSSVAYRIMYAESTDGKTWTAFDHTTAGIDINTDPNATKWNSSHSMGPRVIKDGATYKMWFDGYDGTNTRILYAESTDGKSWTTFDHTVASLNINTDPNATKWNVTDIEAGSIIKDGGLYKMWFDGYAADGKARGMYAESTDGKTWTVTDHAIAGLDIGTDPNSTVWNPNYSYLPSVIKDGTTYKNWFSGYNGTNYRILYAESTDPTQGSYTTTTAAATTSIVLGFDIGPTGGIARVTVDEGTGNELVTDIDTYNASVSTKQRFLVATGLPSGTHTVRIESSGTANTANTSGLAVVTPRFIETNATDAAASASLTVNNRLVDGVITQNTTTLPNGVQFSPKGNISQNTFEGTLETWVQTSWAGNDGVAHQIFDTRSSSTTYDGFTLTKHSDNQVYFTLNNSSSYLNISAVVDATSWPANQPNHIVVRWWKSTSTTTALSIYLNGKKIAENKALSIVPSTHSIMRFGQRYDAANTFNGQIYDLSIYSHAFDDGGISVGQTVTDTNSDLYKSWKSVATVAQKISPLTLGTTTYNAVDGTNTTFALDRGVLLKSDGSAATAGTDVASYVNGAQVTTSSLYAGTFARLSGSLTDQATSLTITSIGNASAINPAGGYFYLGNPEANRRREKIHYTAYNAGTFTLDARGIAGTAATVFAANTIVEVVGSVTLASAPASGSSVYVKYNYAGDAVDRSRSTLTPTLSRDGERENSVTFLDETSDPTTGWGVGKLANSISTTGLVGYWNMNGTITDTSGNANNMSSGTPTYTTGVLGQAVSSLIYTAQPVALFPKVEQDWTLSMWVNVDTSKDAVQLGGDGNGFLFGRGNYLCGSGSVRSGDWGMTYYRAGLSDWHCEDSGTPLLAGWHHLLVAKSGTSGAMYLDGIAVHPFTFTSAAEHANGQSHTANAGTTLGIDDYSIWSRALTPDEITALSTRGTLATTLPAQTAIGSFYGTDATQLFTPDRVSGGVSQITIDEGTSDERRILLDQNTDGSAKTAKSLATGLTDGWHTYRFVAGVNKTNSGSNRYTTWDALHVNGSQPLLVSASSSSLAPDQTLPDLTEKDATASGVASGTSANATNDVYVYDTTTEGTVAANTTRTASVDFTTQSDYSLQDSTKSQVSGGVAGLKQVTGSMNWNLADKNANYTLSNSNLTASQSTGGWISLRANNPITSGKWYWEVQEVKGGSRGIGIARSTASLNDIFGRDANAWVLQSDGSAYTNSTYTASCPSYHANASSTIGIALDMTAGKIWWSVNGTWCGSPTAGTGAGFSGLTGTVYPGASSDTSGQTFTLNTGGSAFTYTAPSGFSALNNSTAAYPTSTLLTTTTTNTTQLSTTNWSKLSGIAPSEILAGQTSYYSLSLDGCTTWKVWDSTASTWRSIAQNNAGTWQYNSSTASGTTTWTNATTNSQEAAISQAFGVTANQMTGTQLKALTSAQLQGTNGFVPGTTTTINLATALSTSLATSTPTVDAVTFTYDGSPYTLTSTINASATSLSLTSTDTAAITNLPDSGILTLENEKIAYDSISKSTTTAVLESLTRGYLNTTAASHTAAVSATILDATSWRTNSDASWYKAKAGTLRFLGLGNGGFPTQATIIASDTALTITDAANDTNFLTFTVGTGNAIPSRVKAVTASDGVIYAGTESGTIKLDFKADTITKIVGTNFYTAQLATGGTATFADANSGNFYYSDTTALNSTATKARYTFDSFIDDGRVTDGSGNTNHLSPNPVGAAWRQVTGSAGWSARSGHSTLSYNNKIWMIGGSDGTVRNDVWSSSDGLTWTNVLADTASPGANQFSRRMYFGATVYNGKMWVIGGDTGSVKLNDVWSSTDGVTWTQATASASFAIRQSLGVITYDSKMWVIGGGNSSGNSSGNCNGSGSNYCRDVWYSTDGVTWTQATDAPAWSARSGVGGIVYNGKMWISGGDGPICNGASTRSCKDVWSSTDGVTWTQATASAGWAARGWHSMTVYGNKMWILGGWAGQASDQVNCSSNVSVLACTDIWSSTDGATWTQATATAPWVGRYSLTSAIFNNKLWIFGGYTNNAANAGDIWYTSTPTFTTDGVSGRAAEFSGSKEYLVTSTKIATSTLGAISAWVKPNGTGYGLQQGIMGGFDPTAGGSDIGARSFMMINATGSAQCAGQWMIVLGNSLTSQEVCSGQVYNTANFPANNWVYVVVTYDGGNVQFYKNGTLINTVAQTVSAAGNAQPFYIGGAGALSFMGSIDEPFLISKSLSASEIRDLYEAGLASLRAGKITSLATNNQTTSSLAIGTKNRQISNQSKVFVVNTKTNDVVSSDNLNPISKVTFDPSGNLFYASGTKIARVPIDTSAANAMQIKNSLRFNGTNGYLSRTPSVAGNRKTWTWSGWVKRGKLGAQQHLFGGDNAGSFLAFNATDNLLVGFYGNTSATQYGLTSTSVYRDPSAWYHIMLTADTTQSTSTNRLRLYVNGAQISSFSSATYPALNDAGQINSVIAHDIGRYNAANGFYLDGYLSDSNLIDGQALDPTYFGQFDSTGRFVPKKYSGTYGVNGFHLDFTDSSALGKDTSGMGNTWTVNNITAADQMIDTPTNNFATLNPLEHTSSAANNGTYTNGNLTVTAASGSSANFEAHADTIRMRSGKWFFETNVVSVGVLNTSAPTTLSVVGNIQVAYRQDGYVYTTSSGSWNPYGASWTTGDIVGFALDLDSGFMTYYKNGVSQGAISIPTGSDYRLYTYANATASAASILTYNFGQGGQTGLNYYQDAGGYFKYAPPAGFKALSTANLPTPTIQNPKQYFDTKLYTGNGTSQSITGLKFQPDLVWTKSRQDLSGVWGGGPGDHDLVDSVRGMQKNIYTGSTSLQATGVGLTSFNSDGFTLDSYTNVNASGYNFVSWNWKKGATPGFDVVNINNAGAAGVVSWNHTLGTTPAFMLIKRTDSTSNWYVWHKSLSSATDSYLFLNGTGSTQTSANVWGAGPNSSQLSFNTWASSQAIAYVWSEVPGFSKFGSYTGNGNADGPFVYTGFKPRYIMWKRTDTAGEHWWMYDSARNVSNPVNNYLTADTSNAEGTNSIFNIDFNANGWKVRTSDTGVNASGGTYIYAAFAEQTLKPSISAYDPAGGVTTDTGSYATTVNTLAADTTSTNLYAGTNAGVEKFTASTLTRSGSSAFLAQSSGTNNILAGTTNTVAALATDSSTGDLAIGTSSRTQADTEDGATKLLLHADGANTATTFVDSSGLNQSVTATNATISTTQSKFGGASASFNGTSAYLAVPNSPDWDMGTGDFTIDLWAKPTLTATAQDAFRTATSDNSSITIGVNSSNQWIYRVAYAGCTAYKAASASTATGNWQHLAVVRTNDSAKFYIDGVLAATSSAFGGSPTCYSAQGLRLGMNFDGTNPFNGYLDELRITKGIARWTAAFTPPTAPYSPEVSYTAGTGALTVATSLSGTPTASYTYDTKTAGTDGLTDDRFVSLGWLPNYRANSTSWNYRRLIVGTQEGTNTVQISAGAVNDPTNLQIYASDTTTIITNGSAGDKTVVLKPSVSHNEANKRITVFVNLTSGTLSSYATPLTTNADGLGNAACVSGTAYAACTSKIWYAQSTLGDYTVTAYQPTITIPGLPEETSFKVQATASDAFPVAQTDAFPYDTYVALLPTQSTSVTRKYQTIG